MSQAPHTIVYQAGKLGDVLYVLQDVDLARQVDGAGLPVGRIYGNSGGALVALAHAVVLAARAQPGRFTPQAPEALADLEAFLRTARSRDVRRFNWRGLKYGFYNLDPLQEWLLGRMAAYTGRSDPAALTFTDLGFPVYLCTQDRDGFPVFFGPPDDALLARYHNCSTRIEDGPLVDACIAALSTMLSTDAYPVNGRYYKDGRPAFADISAMVLDMEQADPRPIVKSRPHAPLPTWRANAVSQVFIMHRWHERNQADLTAHYNDLLARRRTLQAQADALVADLERRGLADLAREHFGAWPDPDGPRVLHTDVPYLGSTEAAVNMRQSVANKDALMRQFAELGTPQLDGFDFGRPFTIVYGAGGFSGILAGLVMTRAVDARGGDVQRIFGCSAGVLNGLFHAAVLGARRHPELYTPEALDGLAHLETFFEQLEPEKLYRVNRTPRALARAVVNWGPLREQLCRYIERWTGRPDGSAVTFEDVQLPFYATGARGSDGYADFFGVPGTLEMRFAGRTLRPINCPIVDAVIGGMAQPFYVTPPVIHGETYFDGGGAFYDIGLFAAALTPPEGRPVSLLNMHFCEPPEHSYGFDERPDLKRIIFDTHNFTFPEERRRMRKIVDLFYDHEALRRCLAHLAGALEAAGQAHLLAAHDLPDLQTPWWRTWTLQPETNNLQQPTCNLQPVTPTREAPHAHS